MNDVVKSKPAHLWTKGKSGNPAGRPKGSRNAVTLLKTVVEGDLRTQMREALPEIVTQALNLAKGGDKDMIKLVLGMWVSPAKAAADEDAPRERVQIVIGRLTEDTPVKASRVLEHNPQE